MNSLEVKVGDIVKLIKADRKYTELIPGNAYSLKRMVRSLDNDIQKLGRVRFVSCLSPCLVILSISLMFFSTSAISTIYTAQLQ